MGRVLEQGLAWAGGPIAGALLLLVGVASLAALGAWLHLRQRAQGLQRRLDRAAAQIEVLRSADPLTGLSTRATFEDTLDQATLACDRGGVPLALLYVDLDSFRAINDGYGLRVGDALLVETARRLGKVVSAPAHAARLSSDEFALLVEAGPDQAAAVAEKVLAVLRQPYQAEGLGLQLTASVGIALYPEHGSRPRLAQSAALAMRSVKLGGGAGYAHYTPAMGVSAREQAELMQDLRQAIDERKLRLVYQPKLDAASLQITAAEALLRWEHPRRGFVSPEIFVPLAERHGLIAALGRWVIDEACRQAAVWRERGLRMRIAINISGRQLRQDDLVDHIQAALRRHGIPPGRLTCEITESAAMEDTAQTRAAFEQLRKAGLHVSIDDFGTGHSSLAALRRLPAAELKIDRAFIADLASGERARHIVQAVLQMAHTLGLRVVAEGVETEQQRDLLVAMGCDELQGYLFAKPMSPAALALWAENDHSDDAPLFRPSLFDLTQPTELDPPSGA